MIVGGSLQTMKKLGIILQLVSFFDISYIYRIFNALMNDSL